jgi:hypothetical protein
VVLNVTITLLCVKVIIPLSLVAKTDNIESISTPSCVEFTYILPLFLPIWLAVGVVEVFKVLLSKHPGELTPEVPLEPEEPEVPEEPLEPEVPLLPEEPEVPLLPEEPDVPLLPDEPDVPLLPDEPDVPLLPDEPDVPLLPDEPD